MRFSRLAPALQRALGLVGACEKCGERTDTYVLSTGNSKQPVAEVCPSCDATEPYYSMDDYKEPR